MRNARIARRHVLQSLAACALVSGTRASALVQVNAAAAPGPMLMENARVRVYGVRAKPGEAAFGVRSSSQPPRLAIFMQEAKVTLARYGDAPKITPFKVGDLVWDAGDVTRVDNAGSKDLSVYLVEPKGTPAAGSNNPHWQPTSPQAGGRIVYENDYVRVVEHAARPRMGVCGEGMHSHIDHVTVSLASGRLRITKPNEQPVIVEAKAGDVLWDPSGLHAVQNLGTRDSRALLIEIKTA
jgi:hypothetical protein